MLGVDDDRRSWKAKREDLRERERERSGDDVHSNLPKNRQIRKRITKWGSIGHFPRTFHPP